MDGRIEIVLCAWKPSDIIELATAPRGEACDPGGWARWNRIRGGPLNQTIRIYKELPRMASTIKMPPKQQTNDEVAESRAGQGRPVLHRYRIQVDRQTKSSFDDKAAAEKIAKAIKKAHPVVQVAIYDAESNERALIDA